MHTTTACTTCHAAPTLPGAVWPPTCASCAAALAAAYAASARLAAAAYAYSRLPLGAAQRCPAGGLPQHGPQPSHVAHTTCPVDVANPGGQQAACTVLVHGAQPTPAQVQAVAQDHAVPLHRTHLLPAPHGALRVVGHFGGLYVLPCGTWATCPCPLGGPCLPGCPTTAPDPSCDPLCGCGGTGVGPQGGTCPGTGNDPSLHA